MRNRRLVSVVVLLLVVELAGCDAFVRKFTRKKKNENLPQEELVLQPEEYKNPLSKEQQYRQYFSFWQSWQDELIESLLQQKSNKKIKSCAEESVKNLISMKLMLNDDKQKKIDTYIEQMKSLRDSIANDTYGNNSSNYRERAERIKMSIIKDFSYKKVEKCLL